MKYLSWIVTVPLAVAIVVFSINNRSAVQVDPWPFGGPAPIPLYILVFGGAAAGFLAGAILLWLSNAPRRLRSKRQRGRITQLEAELTHLKEPSAPAGPRKDRLPATPPLDSV